MLWLGEGAPDAEVQRALRVRGLVWQARRSGLPWPAARLSPLEPVREGTGTAPDLTGRRLWVLHSERDRQQPLVDTLRTRHASVHGVEAGETHFEHMADSDPDAVIVDAESPSAAFDTLRALWRHGRLRWSPVLLARGDDTALLADRIGETVRILSKDLDAVQRRAAQGARCGLQLELLGPARLLRGLSDTGRVVRITTQTPHMRTELELSDGTLWGARGRYLRGSRGVLEGQAALTALLAQPCGEVIVECLQSPSMQTPRPLDETLAEAAQGVPGAPRDSAIRPAARVRTESGLASAQAPGPRELEQDGTLAGLSGPLLPRRKPRATVPPLATRETDTLSGVRQAPVPKPPLPSAPPRPEPDRVDTLVGRPSEEHFPETLSGASRWSLHGEPEPANDAEPVSAQPDPFGAPLPTRPEPRRVAPRPTPLPRAPGVLRRPKGSHWLWALLIALAVLAALGWARAQAMSTVRNAPTSATSP